MPAVWSANEEDERYVHSLDNAMDPVVELANNKYRTTVQRGEANLFGLRKSLHTMRIS